MQKSKQHKQQAQNVKLSQKIIRKNNDDLSKSNAMLSRIRNANTKMQTLNNTKTALKAYPL